MARRCKHLNGELIEWMKATHVREVVDGVMDDEGLNDPGDITHYEYRCHDCGKSFRAGWSGDRKAPMWMRRFVGALIKPL